MPLDRATELGTIKDLWTEISPHIDAAATRAALAARDFALDLDDSTGSAMRTLMRDKWRAGEAEHGRDWLGMSLEDLYAEINAELQDLVLYHAMILARFPQQISVEAFLSDTDPGDETDESFGVPA